MITNRVSRGAGEEAIIASGDTEVRTFLFCVVFVEDCFSRGYFLAMGKVMMGALEVMLNIFHAYELN